MGGGGIKHALHVWQVYTKVLILYYFSCISDDHSRVVLSLQDNTPGSDYINASYLDVR